MSATQMRINWYQDKGKFLLEPVFCKKRQKKCMTSYWFGEQGTSEGSELFFCRFLQQTDSKPELYGMCSSGISKSFSCSRHRFTIYFYLHLIRNNTDFGCFVFAKRKFVEFVEAWCEQFMKKFKNLTFFKGFFSKKSFTVAIQGWA